MLNKDLNDESIKNSNKAIGQMDVNIYGMETPYEINFIDKIEKNGITYIFLYNNHQIRKYLRVKYPAFDDVRKIVRDNQNIPEKYKVYALEYIDELERYNPNQDLAILYYNMENLKTIKNIDEFSNRSIKGYFNKTKREISVTSEEEEAIAFKHELTHATYSIDINLGDVHIIKDFIHPILIDGNQIEFIGEGLSEGLIDNYRIELGSETLKDKTHASYESFQDLARLFCNILGVNHKLIDLILDNNIRYLMDQMYKIGIVNIGKAVEIIDDCIQDMVKGNINLEEMESSRIVVYTKIFENLIIKMISENKSSTEIYKYVFSLLDDGYIQKEIKRDLSSAMDYLPTQMTLRENIIGCVNFFLEIAHMPTKSPGELTEEFSDFRPQTIADQFFLKN